ncbi:HlyD family secretion protein [Phenylobacterium sp.]|uniref:HlyD family secretion protein n=1 Tax=Phenylobacterium sp. TaxID=1871053 RepID=UPI002CC0A60C|nr:efflux RND transporter periplasmic adaptor subunit [Phenylobacterium sp.]HLZ77686.1 efflux RND transporter periplasmic adaptor subunit [Phenylobacterium sp.]
MLDLIRRPAVWLTALGIVAIAALAAVVVNIGRTPAMATPANPARAQTPYAAVSEGKADVEGGIIQVASRTAGVVREVDVREGDRVTKGEVLARQEDDAPRLAVRTAEAALTQARAQLGVTQVQLVAARREKARLESLAGVVSGQQVDQAADAISSAQASLTSEQAAIGVAGTQLNEARYRLEQTIVRAPVNGVIVRRYANPGTGASTLNVTPMFDLEPAGARIVRAEVTESALPLVRIGQPVKIVPESDQSKSYPGEVLRQAAVFGARKLQSDDPSERTDERVVEVVVSANGAPLLIGQRVLVKFVKPGG